MLTIESFNAKIGQKFEAKDLVELYQDEQELKMRGRPLYALVCREATAQECADYELLTGNRKDWTFYRCIVEDEIHFVASQFMTLTQRSEGEKEEKLEKPAKKKSK